MLCSQESGWRSRARRQPSCRRGGTVPVPDDSPLGVLHLPVLGCRSCTSIVPHVREGSFPSCPEIHPLDSWEVDLVRSWRSAAVRYVLHRGLGPCRAPGAARWEALLHPSCFFHIQLGCTHYSTGNSRALTQLFGCLCLVGLWISLGEGSSHLHSLCQIRWCRQMQVIAFP